MMTSTVQPSPRALRTTFSPASSCLNNIYKYGPTQLLGPLTSACYPEGWSNTTTNFYSPGVCPSGYATACSQVETANTITETHATCCPVSYQCASGHTYLCNSLLNGVNTWTFTVVNGESSTTETAVLGGYMIAYGVQIHYQATDVAGPTTAVLTQTVTPSSASPSSSIAPSSSGLSTGAKAGIGVGVALGVIAALILLVLAIRYSRKRRTIDPAPMEELSTRKGNEKKIEAPDSQVFEAPTSERPHELTSTPMHELHG